MRSAIQLAVLAFLCVSFAAPSQAQRASAPRGYEVIDTETYRGRDDQVTFDVGRREGRFASLRFRARDARVNLRDIVVVFGNGDRQRVEVEERLRPGQLSGEIDLKGNRRFIRTVTVNIRTRIRRREEARLVLLGAARNEPPPPKVSYELGGYRNIDLRDRSVTIPVRSRNNEYTHIVIAAKYGDIFVESIVVHGRRSRETFDVDARIKSGSSSPGIRIGRSPRNVERVTVNLAPSRRRGSATVEVHGGVEQERRPPALDTARFAPPPRLDSRGRPEGQLLFGSARVRFRTDKDTIEVGRDAGQFQTIVFRVLERDIRLDTVTIIYGNGQRDRFDIGRRVRGNSVTPTFKLTGERFIDRIEVVYRAAGRGNGPAIIQVYGDYSDRWLNRQLRRGRDEWVLLGSQRAQMFNSDNDTFNVGRRFGRFSALRVRARGNQVRIYGLTVTYANGSTEDVGLYARLNPGETSKAIDLKGNRRFIQKIAIKYRSKLSLAGEGRVEVYGLRGDGTARAGAPAGRDDDDGRDVKDAIRRKLRNIFR